MKKHEHFIIVERDETFLINFDLIKQIQRYDWPVKLIRDVMVKVVPLTSKDNGYNALLKIQNQQANMLPVVKNKKVVGVITLGSLLRSKFS